MLAAATMYYLEDATQADVAQRLRTSRATVSRLLAEARRQGIVRIAVVPPDGRDDADQHLAQQTSDVLGLDAVHLAPAAVSSGTELAPALSTALVDIGLHPGDVLLISSGRTVYEAGLGDLPPLPGVVLAPTIGGQEEPEPWYQPNEITRQIAERVDGHPTFLYAPALPGPGLHRSLLHDPAIRRVLELWDSARCAVLGVGAPPLSRASIPGFVPTDAVSLRRAVGDVCSRFYDRDGTEVPFPGHERLMATPLELVRRIPVGIGVAYGPSKIEGIIAGAAGGYLNRLVTDSATATLLLARAAG